MWIEKWKRNGVLNDSWRRFIKPSNSTPGKMYGLVKTHKEGNPVRVITSGCGTAIENLSIFVEKCLYSEVLNIECRVQDTSEMLTIIDNLNSSLTSDCKLVSFDIINMFPSIDNISGLKSVKKVLESRSNQFPPSNCIIEALKLCLESNNSIFNNKHYLRSDGTAQGPHMSCSYSDIAIQYFDIKALEFNPLVICWKRFRDDIFVVWPHTLEELQIFLNYMNNIDQIKKIQFTMEVAKDSLEFLDLKLTFDKESKKISVDVFSKATNSFTYVLPNTCFPKSNIENIPKGVALRLRRICDSDNKSEKRSKEYQNYFIGRDYKPRKVRKQFSDIRNISREEARQPKTHNERFSTSCNLITQYNPLLPNIKTIIKKHLPVLHSNQNMLEIFPRNTINVTYKRGKNLRELTSPLLFPRVHNQHSSSSEKCQKRCDICTNFLVASTEFTCFATKHKYKVKGILKCTSKNVIYLISCKCCRKQYIGSVIGFKERFRIHKSDINTGKVRCGVANHLLNVCHSEGNKFEYLQIQLKEQVSVNNSKNIDKMLWEREKYWQAQLFTLTHGLNSPNEWYAQNRRGYRK